MPVVTGMIGYLVCSVSEDLNISIFSIASTDTLKSLWSHLRSEDPELLGPFERFLARVTTELKRTHQEHQSLESALRRYFVKINMCIFYHPLQLLVDICKWLMLFWYRNLSCRQSYIVPSPPHVYTSYSFCDTNMNVYRKQWNLLGHQLMFIAYIAIWCA